MADIELSFGAGVVDLAAVVWFFACWIGYTIVADHLSRDDDNVVAIQHRYRRRWMDLMLQREMRMGDVQIVATIIRSASLFASTSLFILAGLVTILGALDKAREVGSGLTFIVDAPRELWEIKVLLLILIFVYAFFKFAWAMRQINIALVVIGAAPLPGVDDGIDHGDYAERAARVLSRSVNTFNRGQRAYYFGLAALSWFIQALVLCRRLDLGGLGSVSPRVPVRGLARPFLRRCSGSRGCRRRRDRGRRGEIVTRLAWLP